MSVEQIERALDSVLKAAVARKDDALIDAYREIYQKVSIGSDRTGESRAHAAFRLGQLLGQRVQFAALDTE